MQSQKKPQGVTVQGVTSKGKINVDLNPTQTVAANKPAPKLEAVEPKSSEDGAVTLNEKLASTAAETSTMKFRVWMIAALAAVVLILLALQFTGGGSDVAEPISASQVSPVVAPVVETAASDSPDDGFVQSDNPDFVHNIIGALRSSTDTAPVTTGSSQSGQTTALNSLYTLVTGALAQGQSADYVDQLLNEALAKGEISVPTGLILPNGKVDTASIIALFSTK